MSDAARLAHAVWFWKLGFAVSPLHELPALVHVRSGQPRGAVCALRSLVPPTPIPWARVLGMSGLEPVLPLSPLATKMLTFGIVKYCESSVRSVPSEGPPQLSLIAITPAWLVAW